MKQAESIAKVSQRMENGKPSISVVVCTRNRAQDLKECIDSIIGQSHSPAEIVVVDSSDNDSTRLLIKEFKKQEKIPIQYIHTKPGLTKQRNIGIKKSRGIIVAFLDDDVILEKLYFKEVIKCFNMSDDISGVGGYITNTNPDNIFERCFRKIFMLTGGGKKGFMKRSGFACFNDANEMDRVATTQILSGCNCCYRKSIFNDYAFDEMFEGYGLMEDVEFSHRVSMRNKLVCTSQAKLVHKRSPSERINLRKYFEMTVFNHFYIFDKNVKKTKLDWIPFWWSDFGVILVSVFHSVKCWSKQPLIGVYSGHLRIIKYICKN